MNTKSSNAETCVEFAIDNAMDRMYLLKGGDQQALLSEYKEWLTSSITDVEILIMDYMGEPYRE